MIRRLGILLGIVLVVSLVRAQDQPPDVFERVLQDLSQRVGVPVTLADLDNYQWLEEVFPDTSLGCAQPDTAYAAVQTRAYRIDLSYNGVSYDYRIASDASVLVLCGTRMIEQDCPPPTGGVDYLPTRLRVGQIARVLPEYTLALRESPNSTGALLADVPQGTELELLEGPRCAYGSYQYWRVQYALEGVGYTGWVVEGYDGIYFLEPREGASIAPGRIRVIPENAASLAPLIALSAQSSALSPDGTRLAIQQRDVLQIINLNEPEGEPVVIPGNQQMVIAFSPDSTLLAVAAIDTIRTYNSESGEPVAQYAAPGAVITVVSFSPPRELPTGEVLSQVIAAGDAQGRLWFWSTAAPPQATAQINVVPDPAGASVVALSFVPDGTRVYARMSDGTTVLLEIGEPVSEVIPTFTPTPSATPGA